MFRIVDELQCWFRPELVPSANNAETAHLAYGADHAELVPVTGGASGRCKVVLYADAAYARNLDDKEAKALRYLAQRQPEVFRALGVEDPATSS